MPNLEVPVRGKAGLDSVPGGTAQHPPGEKVAQPSPNVAVLGPCNPHVAVSIIVLNWNTRELLRDCLASIEENAGDVKYEIIVVDNGSHDGSREMVARRFPSVRLLINERNVGFAPANNQAMREAHGRFLFLLNSDTVVQPGAIEEMVRYMDAHPEAGAIGPHLLNADRSTQLSVFPFPHIVRDVLVTLEVNRWPVIGRLAQWWGQRRDMGMSAQTGMVDYVLGAAIMFRRKALEQVGVLDAGYFFGGEEMDLCYRLRKAGWLTIFDAASEIIHFHGGSRKGIAAAYVVWYHTAKLRFYRLHHPYWQYLAYRAAVALASLGYIASMLLQRRWSVPDDRRLLSAYGQVLTRAVSS